MIPILPWLAGDANLTLALALQPPSQETATATFGDLEVEFGQSVLDRENDRAVFSGGVKATYEGIVLFADELELDYGNSVGIARSGVRVIAEEGTISADEFEFNWEANTGSATNALLWIDGTSIRGGRIEVRSRPGREGQEQVIYIESGSFTTSRRDTPTYEVFFDSLEVEPGRQGTARGFRVRAFGSTLLGLSTYRFSLDPRLQGFQLPTLDYRLDEGFGFAWDNTFGIGTQGAARGFFRVFETRQPTYGLEFAQSFADAEEAVTILPRNDLDERFNESYFERITVTNLTDQARNFGSPRLTVGFGSLFNQLVRDRNREGTEVSKPFELVGELGGRTGDVNSVLTVRGQSIREGRTGQSLTRAAGSLAISTDPVMLAPDLFGQMRLDLFGTASGSNTFGFARGSAGVRYQAGPRFAVGLGYSVGGSTGRPDLIVDQLFSQSTVHLRFDYDFGPYTLRYLTQYDTQSQRWFRSEYEFALAADGFEPYLVIRTFPEELRFGVRVRIGSLGTGLQSRTLGRSEP